MLPLPVLDRLPCVLPHGLANGNGIPRRFASRNDSWVVHQPLQVILAVTPSEARGLFFFDQRWAWSNEIPRLPPRNDKLRPSRMTSCGTIQKMSHKYGGASPEERAATEGL